VNRIANHSVRPARGAYWISPFDVWDRGLHSYCEYVCMYACMYVCMYYVCMYLCLRLLCVYVVSFR